MADKIDTVDREDGGESFRRRRTSTSQIATKAAKTIVEGFRINMLSWDADSRKAVAEIIEDAIAESDRQSAEGAAQPAVGICDFHHWRSFPHRKTDTCVNWRPE